jgi:hypothetical protein
MFNSLGDLRLMEQIMDQFIDQYTLLLKHPAPGAACQV